MFLLNITFSLKLYYSYFGGMQTYIIKWKR